VPEIREKVNELERLQKLNERQASQLLSLENIKDIPKMMNFWTGFPNYGGIPISPFQYRKCLALVSKN
jgi:hypothetical protein